MNYAVSSSLGAAVNNGAPGTQLHCSASDTQIYNTRLDFDNFNYF